MRPTQFNSRKRRPATVCLLLLAASSAPVWGKDVQGPVSGIWSRSESPYVVVGDCHVPPGQTLRILPGVEVRISQNYSLSVYGRLLVEGKPDSQVIFTAVEGQATPWGGLRFDSASDSSTIQDAVIERASVGLTLVGSRISLIRVTLRQNVNGVDCRDGSRVWISGSWFEGNTNRALWAHESYLSLRQCVVRGNATGGIESAVVLSSCRNAQVVQCEFFDNPTAAVEVDQGSSVLLAHNTVAYNEYGILLVRSDSCTVVSNAVCWNRTGIAIEEASPAIRFNDVWGNTENFYGAPSGVGELVTQNRNGTPCDLFGNISVDPGFQAPGGRVFLLLPGSPLVDAGDPANLARIWFSGTCPDIGAHELGLVVPVELVFFRWSRGRLEWRTESETNNWGFAIERSPDGSSWETIGFVPGQGTSSQPHHYTFVDPHPISGTVHYRLIQIDFDGRRTLQGSIQVTLSCSDDTGISVHPNPANPGTAVRIHLPAEWRETGSGQIEILDSCGRRVHLAALEAKAGRDVAFCWDGCDDRGQALPSGVYTVVLRIGDRRAMCKMTLLR